MKIKDIKNEKLTSCPFDKFADKLDKIKKQILFEEEYKKLVERRQYLDKKNAEKK